MKKWYIFFRRFNLVQESMNRQAGILKPQIPNFIGKLCPRYSLEHPFFGMAPQILLPPQKEDYLKSPIISVQMLLSFMVNCHLHFFMRSKATLLCGSAVLWRYHHKKYLYLGINLLTFLYLLYLYSETTSIQCRILKWEKNWRSLL